MCIRDRLQEGAAVSGRTTADLLLRHHLGDLIIVADTVLQREHDGVLTDHGLEMCIRDRGSTEARASLAFSYKMVFVCPKWFCQLCRIPCMPSPLHMVVGCPCDVLGQIDQQENIRSCILY